MIPAEFIPDDASPLQRASAMLGWRGATRARGPAEPFAMVGNEYTFRPVGAISVDPLGYDRGDPLEAAERVTAKCVTARLTRKGRTYIWQRVPGGKFDFFLTLGVPKGIKKA